MIVTMKDSPIEAFVPKSVEIVFESQEELSVFELMCGMNLSVANSVVGGNKTRSALLASMLATIYHRIRSR